MPERGDHRAKIQAAAPIELTAVVGFKRRSDQYLVLPGVAPHYRITGIGLLHNLSPEQVGRFLTFAIHLRRAAGRR